MAVDGSRARGTEIRRSVAIQFLPCLLSEPCWPAWGYRPPPWVRLTTAFGGETPARTRSTRNHPRWVMTRPRRRIMIGRTASHGTRDAEVIRARFRDETDHDPVPLHLEVARSWASNRRHVGRAWRPRGHDHKHPPNPWHDTHAARGSSPTISLGSSSPPMTWSDWSCSGPTAGVDVGRCSTTWELAGTHACLGTRLAMHATVLATRGKPFFRGGGDWQRGRRRPDQATGMPGDR
jgi:hypothetical protein